MLSSDTAPTTRVSASAAPKLTRALGIFDRREAELQTKIDHRDHFAPQVNHALNMGGLLRDGRNVLYSHDLADFEYPDAELLGPELKH